jgi:hypothetical protein
MTRNKCEMTYNFASWTQISPTLTKDRLSRKYSFYRFSNLNHSSNLNSNNNSLESRLEKKVILFLPGHGGDYQQARSLFQRASETLFDLEEENSHKNGQIYELFSSLSVGKTNTPVSFLSFDFLSINFGEEATALLGGAAVRDQAEYVKDCILYIVKTKRVEMGKNYNIDITLVAHSMGSLAAKLAVINLGEYSRSISSIISLSSPHLAPPVQVDSEMSRVYKELKNEGWMWNNEKNKNTRQVARNIPFLAISGGEEDFMIWEPLARLKDDRMAFNRQDQLPPWSWVSSPTIPKVGFSIDHQAILWCRQFINPLALSVLLASSCRDQCTPQERLELLQRGLGLYSKSTITLSSASETSNYTFPMDTTRLETVSAISILAGQDVDLFFSNIYSIRNILAVLPIRFLSPFLVSLFIISLFFSQELWTWIKIEEERKIRLFYSCIFLMLFLGYLTYIYGETRHAHPVTIFIVTTLSIVILLGPISFITSLVFSRLWKLDKKITENILFIFYTVAIAFATHEFINSSSTSLLQNRVFIEALILLVFTVRCIIVLLYELTNWPQTATVVLGMSVSIFPSYIGPVARAIEVLKFPKGFYSTSILTSDDRIFVTSSLYLLAYPYFLQKLRKGRREEERRYTFFNLVVFGLAIQGWSDATVLPLVTVIIVIFYFLSAL